MISVAAIGDFLAGLLGEMCTLDLTERPTPPAPQVTVNVLSLPAAGTVMRELGAGPQVWQ